MFEIPVAQEKIRRFAGFDRAEVAVLAQDASRHKAHGLDRAPEWYFCFG